MMRVGTLLVGLTLLAGCNRGGAPAPATSPAPAPPEPRKAPTRSAGEVAAAKALAPFLRVNPGDPNPKAPVVEAELELAEGKKVPDLEPLAALPRLRRLSVRGFGVNDAVLGDLPPLEGLESLSLSWNRVTDAGLKHLTRHARLRRLSLDARVEGAGLADLAGLKELRTLSVSPDLRPDGVAGVAKITQLEELNLSGNNFLSGGPFSPWLVHLRGLTGLKKLELHRTQVFDPALEHLAGLTNLEELAFSDARIRGEGLEHLAGMTRLRWLTLGSRRLANAGLKEVGKLGSLERLDLTGDEEVTDAGLKELHGLRKLRGLDVSGTKVTASGVAEFRKAVPGCTVRLGDARVKLPFDN
jgi:hypothetical protein